jgi:hypothetical protein
MTKNELIKKIKLAAAIYISEIRKINIFSNLIFYKLIMNLFNESKFVNQMIIHQIDHFLIQYFPLYE